MSDKEKTLSDGAGRGPSSEEKKQPDRNLLEIDLNNLERDCQGQPKLVFVWCKELARARKKSKEAKNRLKLREAEVAMEVKHNPQKYSLDKATEKIIDALTLMDPDVKYLQDKLIDAEYEEDLLEAMKTGLSDRKQQLTNEVSLHGQMYWCKVGTGDMENQERAAAAEKAASSLNKKGKKT